MTAASIRLHPEDSVAIALQDIEMGTTLPDHGLKLVKAVKPGRKLALADFAAGDKLLRYGQIIGQALEPIAAGPHVHTHNLCMGEHTQDYAMAQAIRPCRCWTIPGLLMAITAPMARWGPAIIWGC